MADENLYSLLIRVEGGDLAAAEIIKSKYALKAVGQESAALKERFQEGFQHLALRGFIADAAHSIGLGTELRPVISLLNLGVTQLGESLGFLGTNLALATAGLTAIAGIAVVVYNHFKKHSESIDELVQKQTESFKTTKELNDKLKDYAETLGFLPRNLDELSEATKRLDEIQRGNLSGTVGQQIAAAQKIIATDKELIASKQELMRQETARVSGESGFIRDKDISDANKLSTEIRKLTTDIAAQNETIAKGKQDIEARAQGFKDEEDRIDSIQKKEKEFADFQKKINDDAILAEFEGYSEYIKGLNKRLDAERDYQNKRIEIQERGDEMILRSQLASADKAAAVVSNSVSRMIFEHEKLSQALQDISKQMAEAVIANLAKMAAEAITTSYAFEALKVSMGLF